MSSQQKTRITSGFTIRTRKSKSREPRSRNLARGRACPPRSSPDAAPSRSDLMIFRGLFPALRILQSSSLGRWPRLENWEGKITFLVPPVHPCKQTSPAFSVSPAIPLQCDWTTEAKAEPYRRRSFCLMEDTMPETADKIFCAYCPQFSTSVLVQGLFCISVSPGEALGDRSFWKPEPGCTTTPSCPANRGFIQQSIPLPRSTRGRTGGKSHSRRGNQTAGRDHMLINSLPTLWH